MGAITDVEEAGATYPAKAYKNRSLVVPGVIAALTSVTAKDAVTPLAEGVGYIVSNGSVAFTKTSTIVDGTEVTIVYNKAAVRRVEGLVNTGINVMVVFDGKNIGENDLPVKITYYTLALSPAAQRQLLTSEWGSQEIKGTLQTSRFLTGAGLSKMFKEEHVANVEGG
ncbi:hypothetical protein ACTUVN_002367 [Pseudomonas caspiana]